MFKNLLQGITAPKRIRLKSVEFSEYNKILHKINSFDFSQYSDELLSQAINIFKHRVSLWFSMYDRLNDRNSQIKGTDKPSLNCRMEEISFVEEFLIECFAINKELCKRFLKLDPYPSQILCGIALHFGNIVELPTGEGKTLAAVFPAVLNALSGKGVHIFTFNDYLAKRDAQWMQAVYQAWGLSVGYIQEYMNAESRKTAYNSDITYMTSKQAGFDYLRDTLVYSIEELLHRKFNFVIVDEADSILIDEARIPLVIAGESKSKKTGIDTKLIDAINELELYTHYTFDENKRNVFLTENGVGRLEKRLGCGNLYENNLELLTWINNLIHAKALLKRDVDYIVKDNKVEIVDEFSGRVADKRKWHDGLQMAVEALEGISESGSRRILGKISLQNFISLYPKMCGMTATASTSEEEFLKTYNCKVFAVGAHKKCIRTDYPDLVYTHKAAKLEALVKKVVEIHSSGRPILVGTSSIEESEVLAKLLKKSQVNCVVLNAKNDNEEAELIAQAGRLDRVTVSTNMAGRGVDIKLGDGKPDSAETMKVRELGGLFVIGVNKNECVRVDYQLRGRAGRQGDPGASVFFVSLEDDLLSRFGIKAVLPIKYAELKQSESISDNKLNSLINHIQRVIDGQNFEIRKTTGKYAHILEYQRRLILKMRMELLKQGSSLLKLHRPELYAQLCQKYGLCKVQNIERRVSIHSIDEMWFDFLEFCEDIREGIELVTVGKKNPLDEYNRQVIAEYDCTFGKLSEVILKKLEEVDFSVDEEHISKNGLGTPSATWTYIINDTVDYKKFSLLKLI